MPVQAWSQSLTSQEAASAGFGAFTTAKTVINQSNLLDYPRNYWQIGKKLRVTVCGAIGTLVTTPGTMAFQIMFGSVIAWTSGNVQLNATAHTAMPFKLVVELTCQLANTTVGTAIAKMMGLGVLTGTMFTKTIAATDLWGRVSAADAAVSDVTMMVPTTSPALGTAFDGTLAITQDFFVTFSVNNAANTVRIDQYDVELPN